MAPDTSAVLTPETLLRAYARGIFPMAEGRDDPRIFWVDPRWRGVIPMRGFRMSRSLRRRVRSQAFAVSYDSDFAGVLDGCADRPETWMNQTIIDLYLSLHAPLLDENQRSERVEALLAALSFYPTMRDEAGQPISAKDLLSPSALAQFRSVLFTE